MVARAWYLGEGGAAQQKAVEAKAAAEASSVSTTRSAKSSGGEAEVAKRKRSAPARMISAEEPIAAIAGSAVAGEAPGG